MPTADNTPASGGTMTAAMPNNRARSQACNGPAPPKATRAKPDGSTPRATLTLRSAPSMLAVTTARAPSASMPSRANAWEAPPPSSEPSAP